MINLIGFWQCCRISFLFLFLRQQNFHNRRWWCQPFEFYSFQSGKRTKRIFLHLHRLFVVEPAISLFLLYESFFVTMSNLPQNVLDLVDTDYKAAKETFVLNTENPSLAECLFIICMCLPYYFLYNMTFDFCLKRKVWLSQDERPLWVLIDIHPLISLHRFPSRTSVGSQSSTISYWIHYISIAWILPLRRGWSPITCSWSLRCSSPCCSQSSWEGIRDLSTQLSTLFQ